MSAIAYDERRGRLQTYFDTTASKAWAQLTSDAPVSKIRETVRAGRDRMRATLLSWLPADMGGDQDASSLLPCKAGEGDHPQGGGGGFAAANLSSAESPPHHAAHGPLPPLGGGRDSTARTLLDAGCGTGALAVEAAQRGARVTAIDIAGNLVALARDRAPERLAGAIDFRVGDLLDPALGRFDHVVAMDSLIHYPAAEILAVLSTLAPRVGRSILFTFAPRTPALSLMHAMGKLFPKADRAPAIEPVTEARLRAGVAAHPSLSDWTVNRTQRIASGFYTSQAMELVRR